MLTPVDDYCKTLMFKCPLFHKFHELNKSEKLKGANISTTASVPVGFARKELICTFYVYWWLEISHVLELLLVRIRQKKKCQTNFACKSPTFRAAKLKGFAVFQNKVSALVTWQEGQLEWKHTGQVLPMIFYQTSGWKKQTGHPVRDNPS